MGVFDPRAGFSITLHTIFRKIFTQGHPRKGKEKVMLPCFRDQHQFNRWPDGLERCAGRELYAWACPADAIYIEGIDSTDGQRFSPEGRFRYVYQINYLRYISCGICIEAYPTCVLTMINEFKFINKTCRKLVYEKQDLLVPLMAGMEQPPYPRHLGGNEKAYLLGLPSTGQPDTRATPEQGATR